ncbi:hypothetical protein HMI54_008494 [Coelomomyces lativittatus]|nr:hypothetical protein HMI54_008494 [Coelomomyces lativittatus]
MLHQEEAPNFHDRSNKNVSLPSSSVDVVPVDDVLSEVTNAKVALITGITGQAGSYLAELLLEKGYTVHGIIRRASTFNTSRINHLYHQYEDVQPPKFQLHYGDMTDTTSLIRILRLVKPTEIYNLAAQSHVKVSFELPEYTAEVDALGTLRLLNALCICGFHTTTKFYQASTSELFGNASISPQNESTPFLPRSPYAIAKLYGYWMTCQYRDAYAVYACNGILFNHESPRRGPTFVTKKITQAVASIYFHFHFHDTHSNLHPNTHLTPTTTTTTTPPPFTATTPTRRSPTITSKSSQGLQKSYVKLGNLDAKRDWGHAKDYVVGMWLMLQQKVPQDFVLATGETHTVREFVTLAFEVVNLHIRYI